MEFKSKIRDLSLQIEEITYEKERKEKREKRKGRKEKGEEKGWGKVVEVNFYALSSFPSALQVVARERSQRKPRTSKFLMVGKLGFDVFHV